MKTGTPFPIPFYEGTNFGLFAALKSGSPIPGKKVLIAQTTGSGDYCSFYDVENNTAYQVPAGKSFKCEWGFAVATIAAGMQASLGVATAAAASPTGTPPAGFADLCGQVNFFVTEAAIGKTWCGPVMAVFAANKYPIVRDNGASYAGIAWLIGREE